MIELNRRQLEWDQQVVFSRCEEGEWTKNKTSYKKGLGEDASREVR